MRLHVSQLDAEPESTAHPALPWAIVLASGKSVEIASVPLPDRSRPVHPAQLYSAIDAGLLGTDATQGGRRSWCAPPCPRLLGAGGDDSITPGITWQANAAGMDLLSIVDSMTARFSVGSNRAVTIAPPGPSGNQWLTRNAAARVVR